MKEEKSISIAFLCILQLVICFFSIITCFIHSLSILVGIKFFTFQFLGILLPGYIVLKISKKELSSIIEKSLYSYFFGIVLVLIEYVALMLLNISIYSPFLFLIEVILEFTYLYKNDLFLDIKSNDNKYYICIIFIVLLEIYCLLSVSLSNTFPSISNETFYNLDFMYWVGNNLSFSKGLPVQDYRLVGTPFYYHYFSSILFSQISYFINEDLVTLSFLFSSIIPCVLLVLSSYVLISKVTNKISLICFAMIAILLCDSAFGFLILHLYNCPFGFDYAYAFAMLSISHLIDMYRLDKYSFKDILISCVLIAVCTGFKGPTSVVVLMGYAVIALYMILNKEMKKGLICGLSWLSSFLFVYLFFVSSIFSPMKTDGDGLFFVGLLGGFDQNIGPMNIYASLKSLYSLSDSKILILLSIVLFVIKNNYFSFISCAIVFVYVVVNLLKKKKIDPVLYISLAICTWGVLLTLITHQVGNSQIYFLLSSIPYGVLGGMYILDSYITNRLKYIICIILVYVAIYPNVYNFVKLHAVNYVNDGIDTYNGERYKTIDKSRALDGHVTIADYNTALWIKNNTEADAILAIDYFEYNNYKNHQIMGIFSNRFVWNDGEYSSFSDEVERRQEIVNKIIANEYNIDLLKAEGVKYFIKTPSGYNDYELDRNSVDVVYNKNGYTVYKLK